MMDKEDYESAEKYLKENIFDKPKNYFNLDKLKTSLKLDRKPTIKELLLNIFGVGKIKLKLKSNFMMNLINLKKNHLTIENLLKL